MIYQLLNGKWINTDNLGKVRYFKKIPGEQWSKLEIEYKWQIPKDHYDEFDFPETKDVHVLIEKEAEFLKSKLSGEIK